LISDTEMDALLTSGSVRVRGPELARLAAALAGHELHWASATDLVVSGLSAEEVGDLAYQTGVRLHELRPVETSLEQAYMELTADSVEYTEPTR
jgi:ABC-2 type transport system ATP-binding protein